MHNLKLIGEASRSGNRLGRVGVGCDVEAEEEVEIWPIDKSR